MNLTHTVQPDGSWVGGCCDEQYPPALPPLGVHIDSDRGFPIGILDAVDMAFIYRSRIEVDEVEEEPWGSWPAWAVWVVINFCDRFGPEKDEEFYQCK